MLKIIKNNKYMLLISLLLLLSVCNFTIAQKKDNNKDIFKIEELAHSMTTNDSYTIDLREPYYNARPNKKDGKVYWNSDNPDIIDIAECKNMIVCTIKPKKEGETAITAEFKNKKGKVLDKDTIYIKISSSEKIYIYEKDNQYYYDKETDQHYHNDNEYTEKYHYTCRNIKCDATAGKYHMIINDGKYYLTIKYDDKDNNTDSLSRTYGCDQLLCNTSYKEKIPFKNITELLDDQYEIKGFIISKEGNHKGIYSIKKSELKSIEFIGYKEYENNNYLLYDNENSYLYNIIDNEYTKIKFDSRNIQQTYVNGSKYYYLSKDITNPNRYCIILDYNYNPLFNSKLFEYAIFYNNRLYTYETINTKKNVIVYDLDGSKINPTENEDFEKDLEIITKGNN